MISLSKIDGGILKARFVFPEEFAGFQGHFPSHKVLPGVCQILCVNLMFEKSIGRPVVLKEIISAKFISPVLPLEEIACVCTNNAGNGHKYTLKASISKLAGKISEIKLKVIV
jgi:3-hydroxyacyl-[acyl-carrier-protein] dehydratase